MGNYYQPEIETMPLGPASGAAEQAPGGAGETCV